MTKSYTQKTKPYEGIYELLDELQKLDCNIGILSNKPHEFTVAYADSLFAKYNIKEVHGQKSDVPKNQIQLLQLPLQIVLIHLAKKYIL